VHSPGRVGAKGAVALLEYGAPDETVDNVAAMWVPARAPNAGGELL
jgi:glucan biosynthesis protein